MQVCTSFQTDNHVSTPPLTFTGRVPFLPPNQQRQSTEGTEVTLLEFRQYHLKPKTGVLFKNKNPKTLKTLTLFVSFHGFRNRGIPGLRNTLGSMCGSPLSQSYDLFQGPPESTRPAPNGTVAMLESSLGRLQVVSWRYCPGLYSVCTTLLSTHYILLAIHNTCWHPTRQKYK